MTPDDLQPKPLSTSGLPALQMEERGCRTCKFLEFEGADRGDAASGECRRYAPQPGLSAESANWPRVSWDDWCGEWQEGVSYEEMIRMARHVADA